MEVAPKWRIIRHFWKYTIHIYALKLRIPMPPTVYSESGLGTLSTDFEYILGVTDARVSGQVPATAYGHPRRVLVRFVNSDILSKAYRRSRWVDEVAMVVHPNTKTRSRVP